MDRRHGHRLARTMARFAAALVCFGVIFAYVEREWDWRIGMGVVRLGEACGGQTAWLSGRMAIGQGGPFHGGTAVDRTFNWLWRQSWFAAAGAGFAGAAGVALVLSGRSAPRERGVTTCGWCGYALRGLEEPRCPECGRAI